MQYHPEEIEKKWQKHWAENKTFKAANSSKKPPYFVLDMFPYPSGAGLHVGHPLGYIASDIHARYKRLQGFNVLHPMGYDSFGLPAEQYAIQTGTHPAITTKENIATYRRQMDSIGFSFDWDREIRTSDPSYYKWTQWIFLQLFDALYCKNADAARPIAKLIAEFAQHGNKNVNAHCDETEAFSADEWNTWSEKKQQTVLLNYRIAYLSEAYVNWCPQLGNVLANDEIKDGVSERGGYPVERKLMKQWSMRITAYSQRLLDGLDDIDWSSSLKEMQRNWIGRSEGASIKFEILSNAPSSDQGGSPPAKGEYPEGGRGFYPAKGERVLMNLPKLKTFRTELRNNLTPAEAKLWTSLSSKQLEGRKFRRQHSVGNYILDFYCPSEKLAVELDGAGHSQVNVQEYDHERTLFLEHFGIKVLRFENRSVFEQTENVLGEIQRNFGWIKDHPVPSGHPSFAGGEQRSDQTFEVEKKVIEVFTTRPDTIFGVSFMTLAPEHELVAEITTPEQKEKIEAYIAKAKARSDRERMADVKTISGEFTGAYAVHPFTGNSIPIWIGDYVLAGYGTGAVMAVPSGDQRDWSFAKHFNLPIIPVIEGSDIEKEANESKDGILMNSDFLNGLKVKAAISLTIKKLEEKKIGEGKINYRQRDAVFGRQRYWGEPIPIYYKDGVPYPVKEEHLPIELPEIDEYLPTETGEPPLARAKNWGYDSERGAVQVSPSLAGGQGEAVYPFELSTMPGWAGSSWYYLRYMDPHNDNEFVGREALENWQNVDFYLGGSEHATGHLLYVRFWTKFLKDLGHLPFDEPAKKLINQGMIQGVSSLLRVEKYTDRNGGLRHVATGEGTGSDSGPLLNIPIDLVETDGGGQFLTRTNYETLKKRDSRFSDIEFENLEHLRHLNLARDYENEISIVRLSSFVEKMSKSKYNVVNPDDIIERYGADTLRLYEMFLGPLEDAKPWNTNGIEGVFRFLKKFWNLFHSKDGFSISEEKPTAKELKALHATIKKVQEDIERLSLNTCVSQFMICVNELTDLKCNKRAILEPLTVVVSTYAPHICEELWQKLGHGKSITFTEYPAFNASYLVEDSVKYPISFNGKTRLTLELPASMGKEEVEQFVLANEDVQKRLDGALPKKVIVVPKRIVNIVV